MARELVVSGMRPTGRLHLGNYWGALRNWIALTRDFDCYFFVADWHMLTTGYEDSSKLGEYAREMALDWLAAGLDPERCVIFRQSQVPEHAELAVLLGMLTPLGWLENNPTWKEQLQELSRTKEGKLKAQIAAMAPLKGRGESRMEEEIDDPSERAPGAASGDDALRTFGFLGYPVLQAADVLLYKAARVPVGQDQLPHLELSREIARRFNRVYGELFPEPRPLVTETPKLPGLDGKKMSKSYGNTLDLLETEESLRAKVMSMYTDPGKIRANTPGHPDPSPENPPGCVVYALHKLYTKDWAPIGEDCRAGRLGCVADKREKLLPSLEKPFSEFRAARKQLESEPGRVDAILEAGARKAKAAAEKTMDEVRRAMGLPARGKA